jgi:hypothetical protein
MLPRLTAEESLEAVQRTAIGSGVMPADGQRDAQRRWHEAINPPAPRPATRQAPDPARLRAMGIGFRRVTVPAKPVES